MSKKWHIHEGFYIEEVGPDVIAICYEPDEQIVLLTIDEIGSVIGALQKAKDHYDKEVQFATDIEAYERWGRERTPADLGEKPVAVYMTNAEATP